MHVTNCEENIGPMAGQAGEGAAKMVHWILRIMPWVAHLLPDNKWEVSVFTHKYTHIRISPII